MPRRIILVLSGVVFFSGFNLAQADVLINEIKYSPTSKQWIEIYNNTESYIDITKYKLLDSSVTTGHKILALEGGTNLVPKHSFAVVAKVPGDFSGASFPVFKSALNIKVSGDKVVLKNESGENISAVDIDGSAVDGKSLQLVNGAWVSAKPSPGGKNKIIIPPSPTPKTIVTTKKTELSPSKNISQNENLTEIDEKKISVENPQILAENLPKEDKNLTFSVVALILLLGAGGGMAYFVRKKAVTAGGIEDFEILEE